MKKIIFIICMLCVFTSLLFAQSEKGARKKERAEEKLKMEQLIKKAVINQSFTFNGLSMGGGFESGAMLSEGGNAVFIEPNSLRCILPYSSISQVPGSPDFLNFMATNYEYKVSADSNQPDILYVDITTGNAVNQSVNNNSLAQVMGYKLHFKIILSTTSATLSLTPEFYPAVNYMGSVNKN